MAPFSVSLRQGGAGLLAWGHGRAAGLPLRVQKKTLGKGPTKPIIKTSIIKKNTSHKEQIRCCDCSLSKARTTNAIVLKAVVLQLYLHTRCATAVVLIAVVLQSPCKPLICGIFNEIH